MANRITKNMHIETLRGMAILLVVLGHVIGSGPEGGMKIDYPHPLRYLYIWIDYIQMPLFTAIAGWVYAMKPVLDYRLFVKKKTLRLLVPMIVVVMAYFLLQYLIPGTNNKGELTQIWKLFIFPYSLYWYLPSLFLIFIIQCIIDKQKGMETPLNFIVLLLIFYFCNIIERYYIPSVIPNFFSFRGALNQLPYFLIGVGLFRFKSFFINNVKIKIVSIIAAIIGAVLLQFEWKYTLTNEFLYELFQPLWSIFTLVLLLNYSSIVVPLFSSLGQYAYSIYLFHGFCTAGGRIVLKLLGLNNVYVLFVCISLIALFVPILLEKILVKYRWSRICFLGLSS